MSTPVIVTRISVPPPLPQAIHRQRLMERLEEGLHRKLSLVSAPAGFGKTTLISEWVAGLGRPTAWLSLDGTDNEVTRVLEYLVSALRTVEPGIGVEVLRALQRPQPPAFDAILTGLINELNTLTAPVVLVMDDYHLVDSPAVDEAIAFLLTNLPPTLHLVITTREDPRLPLSRLRARGQMTELRAADLRFTTEEAATFLREVMGLHLSATDVRALEDRTEGWIAGLQLAALSLQGREDPGGFIRAFAGDHRYIVDYLIDEVLARQPEHIREFLLQTSILDRLCGPLCDAVTGRADSRTLLDRLERSNLFVVPLDETRQWYRYHHLFADVLRANAMVGSPGDVRLRHRSASAWYEQNGMLDDAVRHALAGQDLLRAAALIEMSALRMLGTRQEASLYEWLRAIPEDLLQRMPVLSVYDGFASLGTAGLDVAEAKFRDAERWLDLSPDTSRDEMIVVDQAAYRSLPGTIAVGRAYRAGAMGDVSGIVQYASRARDVTPPIDDLWSGAASAVLGIGYWTQGELEPAYVAFDEGKSRLERAGYMQFQIVSVHILADIRVAQGRLRDAERIYEQALRIATEQGDATWGAVDVHVGLSELLRERNHLDAAIHHLQQARASGEHVGLPDTRHRWHVAMADIRIAEGHLDEAIALLDEAGRVRIPGADPDLRPAAARIAQVHVAQGRLDEAMAWARERGLSADDTLTYLREFQHMTLARILLARFRRDGDETAIRQAVTLLDRLCSAAESGERMGSVIEILVLQALVCEAQDDIPGALTALEQALALAEPEGYIRVFVGEGAPMARLLAGAAVDDDMSAYVHRLLAACDTPVPASGRKATSSHPLTEPLTDRELEVLRLVADGLSNQEIADRLFLALSTVKGHNREIFGKLQVQRRTEAVARARELGVL